MGLPLRTKSARQRRQAFMIIDSITSFLIKARYLKLNGLNEVIKGRSAPEITTKNGWKFYVISVSPASSITRGSYYRSSLVMKTGWLKISFCLCKKAEVV